MVVHASRDVALLPGPAPIWDSDWVSVLPSSIIVDDVCRWQYSVGMLVKLAAFLGTLHRPASGADLGGGGVSCVELLIWFELWACERLVLEWAIPRCKRPCRPISV